VLLLPVKVWKERNFPPPLFILVHIRWISSDQQSAFLRSAPIHAAFSFLCERLLQRQAEPALTILGLLQADAAACDFGFDLAGTERNGSSQLLAREDESDTRHCFPIGTGSNGDRTHPERYYHNL
jgi:hypothetical protein